MLDKVADVNVVYAVESFDQVSEDIKTLMLENWKEIGTYKDIPLDPDFEYYKKLSEFGLMFIYTVRDAGRLVGYAIFTVSPNVLYKKHKWALNGPIWIHPDHRGKGVGRSLVSFWESELKQAGADVIRITVEVVHPTMAYLLNECGYDPVEASYAKRIS